MKSAIEPGPTVRTEGWQAYLTLPDHDYAHERIVIGGLDHWYTVVLCEELARSGSLATAIGLLAHAEFALAAATPTGPASRRRSSCARRSPASASPASG